MPRSGTMYEELNPSLRLCSCKKPSDRGGTGPPTAYLSEPTLNIHSAVLNRNTLECAFCFGQISRKKKSVFARHFDRNPSMGGFFQTHICELYLASNVRETLCEARQVYCSYAACHPEPTTWLADHLQLDAACYWKNSPHLTVRRVIKAAWRKGIHFFEVKLWNT